MDTNGQFSPKNYILFFIFLIIGYLWTPDSNKPSYKLIGFKQYLENNKLEDLADIILRIGIDSVEKFAAIDINKSFSQNKLDELSVSRLKIESEFLKEKFILEAWLQSVGYEKYFSRFEEQNINSLNQVIEISDDVLLLITSKDNSIYDFNFLHMNIKALKNDEEKNSRLSSLKSSLWLRKKKEFLNNSFHFGYDTIFYTFLCVFLSYFTYYVHGERLSTSKKNIIEFITGNYLDPAKTEITWEWSEPKQVGSSVSFRLKFYKRNYSLYKISELDTLAIEITNSYVKSTPTVEIHEEEGNHYVLAAFIVTKAGEYEVSVFINGKHIAESPFKKRFVSSCMDASKSEIIHHNNVMVYSSSSQFSLTISPKDQYENVCLYDPCYAQSDKYLIQISESRFCTPWTPEFVVSYDERSKFISLQTLIDKEGCYDVSILFENVPLKNSKFTALVLNEKDKVIVDKTIQKKTHSIPYEARILNSNNQTHAKPKKVYCYISPKSYFYSIMDTFTEYSEGLSQRNPMQLIIKEFFLKVIPKRLFTFRVCPSTKMKFMGFHEQYNAPILEIDDGTQAPIIIAIKDRNIFAAIFTSFLLRNIGGSETFTDKLDYFYHELREIHRKNPHNILKLKIDRNNILDSSMKAVNYYSTADWCKKFEISFTNEIGIDWGGLRREWFELVCVELFDPTKTKLFQRFKNDSQGLVHPNINRFPHLKLKYYEFAGKIVGKSIFESSLGLEFRQNVKARFSRSFLAQLIGLRVNYKYFMHDDPELYTSKIRYIEENDVDDMELQFSEDIYENGKLVKVVDLIPNGSSIKVTNKNKLHYLDNLAQYKLAVCVKDEIDAFMKGFNELVPDNLLCIFDENELELLICGTGNYSISDLKTHHTMSAPLFGSKRVGDWFWTIITNYSQEEMARLLQFTTGCSQLPPGGFADLVPNIQIVLNSKNGGLPTAHTCFNQLCLPMYDTMDQMKEALKLAIEEGNTGFGLA